MKQLDRGWKTCLAALIATLGCGGHGADGSGIGGETNWLASCVSDNDCGVGHCLCNVCTTECTPGADSCRAGPPESRCAGASELASSCGAVIGGGLCLAAETDVVPDPTPSPDPAAASSPSLDSTIEALALDLVRLPGQDWRFARYLSFSNQSPWNGRMALTKLANSLSSRSQPSVPVDVDEQRVFQRIDLRAYGWDRPVTVDGVQYADGWEAIVAHAALAVAYPLMGGDSLQDYTGTRVPWLFADDFVAAAASGNTYYELLGLPETLAELQQRLVPEAGSASLTYRAAFSDSGISYNPRAVEWRGSAESGRGYWQAFDFNTHARGAAIYSEPLGFVPDETEVMFTLPNGLHGFFIADAGGHRVSQSALSPEAVLDPAQPDWVLRNAASCFSCHNAGVVFFTDTVRSNWEPAVAGSVTAEQRAVLDAYPPHDVLAQVRNDDNEAFARSLEAAGVPSDTPDYVSRTFLEFKYLATDADRAARELFVTPAQLRAHLEELPEPLRVFELDGATVPRDVFLSVYLEALCALHQTDQVVPARCR